MEKEIKEDIMLYLNNIKLDDKLLEPEIYEDMIKKLNSRTPESSLFMTDNSIIMILRKLVQFNLHCTLNLVIFLMNFRSN